MEKLSTATNAINWFEIPVTDVARAKEFYETVFDTEMQRFEMMGMQMVMFPSQSPKIGGALVKGINHTPGSTGTIIYLNGNPDLQLVLDRIENAGGKTPLPKTLINEQTGYMAFFADTEGNVLGLHSGR